VPRIALHISNLPADFVRMIEETVPTSTRPNWVVGRAEPETDEPQAAGLLEDFDHLFGFVAVLPDHEMYVVGHDRARVTRIGTLRHDLAEGLRDASHVFHAQFQQGEL